MSFVTPSVSGDGGEGAGAVAALLDRMYAAGQASAAVAAVGDDREVGLVCSAGGVRCGRGRRPRIDDRFDLASLTKPFAATLALVLDRRGLLPLDLELGAAWSGERVAPPLARLPLERLLRHRAGLMAWTPLYRRCRTIATAVRRLLAGEWRGGGARYGDLDFILWGLTVERVLGEPVGALLTRHVLRPLGLRTAGWAPGARESIVECGLDNRREVELAAIQGVRLARRPPPARGVVHDGNAAFLGARAAHAGLFASARHVWRLGAEWLRPRILLDEGAVAAALSGGRGRHVLGWWRRRVRGSAGPHLGPAAFGHVGFTGCSLWVDPDAGRVLVLLAHRAPGAAPLTARRREFHRIALRGGGESE